MEKEENKSALLINTFHQVMTAIPGQTKNAESKLRRIMADNITGFGSCWAQSELFIALIK